VVARQLEAVGQRTGVNRSLGTSLADRHTGRTQQGALHPCEAVHRGSVLAFGLPAPQLL